MKRKKMLYKSGILLFILMVIELMSVGPVMAELEPLTITTTNLPHCTMGVAYSAILEASGGVPPYTWSIIHQQYDGRLPSWLELDSVTGTIFGKNESTDDYPGLHLSGYFFMVMVTDNNSAEDTQLLDIQIIPAPLTITTTSLPDGTIGVPYSETMAAYGGFRAFHYIWEIIDGALPDGLWLLGDTITGSPTTSGVTNFTIMAADVVPEIVLDTATQALSITINPASNAPSANAGGPYTGNTGSSVSFDGSGSNDIDGTIVSYEWDFGDNTFGSGEAPTHVYLSAGAYTVTLTVTDDDGGVGTDTAVVTVTLTVNASVIGGHGSVNPASQTVNYNDPASISISPDIGYHIASISDNGNPMAITNPYVISNVTANHAVVVTLAAATSPVVGGEIYPVNKFAVLAPWFAASAIIMACCAITLGRKRNVKTKR